MADQTPRVLSRDEMRTIVCGEESQVRASFLECHGSVISDLVDRAWRAHGELQRKHSAWGSDNRRRMAVALMAHTGINNVVSSVALLVSGFPVPSGNLMRQYVEALAMALLFADESLPDFERYEANRNHFNANGAVERLRNRKVGASVQKALDITSDAWQTLANTRDFYHKHSHNTSVAQGYLMDMREGVGAVLGAHYDPSKAEFYETEFQGRVVGLTTLERLVEVLDRRWGPKAGDGARTA